MIAPKQALVCICIGLLCTEVKAQETGEELPALEQVAEAPGQEPASTETQVAVNTAVFSDQALLEMFDALQCAEQRETDSLFTTVAPNVPTTGRTPNLTAEAPGLSATGGLNAAELVSAAVQTTTEGVSAGIVFSPFMLLQDRRPFLEGVHVALASLKGERTRFRLGYSIDTSSPELQFPVCTRPNRQPVRTAAVRTAYIEVCRDLLENPWVGGSCCANATDCDEASCENSYNEAAAACGAVAQNPSCDSPIVAGGLAQAIRVINEWRSEERDVLNRHANVPTNARAEDHITDVEIQRRAQELATRHRTIRSFIAELEQWSRPHPLGCYDSPEGTQRLTEEIARRQWRAGYHRIGLGGQLDAFPVRTSVTDEETPPAVSGWEVRGEWEMRTRGFRSTLDLAVGASRAENAQANPLRSYLAPAVSLAVQLTSLDGTARAEQTRATPRLLAGLSASVRIPLQDDPLRQSNVEQVEVAAYLDFITSASVGFRLSIPVTAKLVADDAEMPTLRDLQWTVPFSVTTILSL